jgi:hypothetical protein
MKGKIAKYQGSFDGYPIFYTIETYGNVELKHKLENKLFKIINKKTFKQKLYEIIKHN